MNIPEDQDASRELTKEEARRRRFWQWTILAALVIGYSGFYLCRVYFSVVKKSLLTEFGPVGLDKESIGAIASLGVSFYAAGKFLWGMLTDIIGGKRMFLISMFGAVLFSLAFAASPTVPLLTLAWVLNRLIQSGGWNGMTRIISRWFPYTSYGGAIGVLSMSYLFGDFLSRQFLGKLLAMGLNWRQVIFVAVGILFVLFIFAIFLIKESPKMMNMQEPAANPENVFGEQGQKHEKIGLIAILKPLLTSLRFWVVCLLCFGMTMVRETFNDWNPLYLQEIAGLNEADAAIASSYFPLFGGISVLACGFLSDRLGRNGRAIIIVTGMSFLLPLLYSLSLLQPGASATTTVITLALIGFLMLGPYSFLAGTIPLDFGGKQGAGSAAGWIDGVGYLGGIFAGAAIGKIAKDQGWGSAFSTLTVVAVVTWLASLVYLLIQKRSAKR